MANHLKNETSPYLLQHAENPVHWYPWCGEAFERARAEDKPVFLSIGYSTCHWCHVMAHESFEDREIADILNRHYISVKVDKEERPDIDSIYMAVCQAFTGSGGWPTSIFMTPEKKPFFAGTYFPKRSRGGMAGLRELLLFLHEKWVNDRTGLLEQADEIEAELQRPGAPHTGHDGSALPDAAVTLYKRIYDERDGGFGGAPKFPTPHNLLFLMAFHQRRGDEKCLAMAEHTLLQMYRGGLFDHIGYGFSRYSTDRRFLVPHFEKMLYDNALLMLAYTKAYALTKKPLYLSVAEKTAAYVLREMTGPEGGFYSAQDADSEGEEGKYYLLTPKEIEDVLGPEDGAAFCRRFDISKKGNFEGKSIPNLLKSDPKDDALDGLLPKVREYRKARYSLHLDDKVLTAWNGLMAAALCSLYCASGKAEYLDAAKRADAFLRQNLMEENRLFVSFRAGKRGVQGFLDDYAAALFAQLHLYRATLDPEYLDRAEALCGQAISLFQDEENGGFYLYGRESEALLFRPKETYDGAIPSGNSLMAWNLVRLSQLLPGKGYEEQAVRQLDFLRGEAARYPTGHAMFLLALLEREEPSPHVTAVLADEADKNGLPLAVPPDTVITLLPEPTKEYPLKNGRTTYYICKGHSCLPPANELRALH